ncbi:hypothetical protein TIFTF001_031640 [Ficus carica]|uniref:Uncharacterized protein n=1 Tax=Ficus carica TaxID=3494 RepID=A0AA88DVW0_FICCA|nr:hypothetical protein TIFTF001_031640 [Ficus carica]
MLPNLGVIVFVIRFVRGVSRTLRARSSNPGVEVVTLCSCKEKRCSIYVSNVLIFSDIMLRIMSSTFIVPGGMGPSGGGGKSGVEQRVKRLERNTYDYKYNIILVLNSTLHTEESTSISNLLLDLPQTNTQAGKQFQAKVKRALFLSSHSDNEPDQLPLKGVSMKYDLPKEN